MVRINRVVLAFLALMGVAFAPVCAEGAIITLPNVIDLPYNSTKWVWFSVTPETGDPEVVEMGFLAQVGNGLAGPKMNQFDFLTGTIFANDILGAPVDVFLSSGGSTPWIAGYQVLANTLDSDKVVANGIVAGILFDTTGLSPGQTGFRIFDVGASDPGSSSLDSYMIGPSSFDTFLTESPGTILNIIPEPSSLLLALSGIGLAGAAYAARRRARHTQSR